MFCKENPKSIKPYLIYKFIKLCTQKNIAKMLKAIHKVYNQVIL